MELMPMLVPLPTALPRMALPPMALPMLELPRAARAVAKLERMVVPTQEPLRKAETRTVRMRLPRTLTKARPDRTRLISRLKMHSRHKTLSRHRTTSKQMLNRPRMPAH